MLILILIFFAGCAPGKKLIPLRREGDVLKIIETKLIAFDGEAGDYFGHDVSLSGDTALVGAPLKDDYSGAAYIFNRTGSDKWEAGPKLQSPDPEAKAAFGDSVAIDGDWIIIGAPVIMYPTPKAGWAYIFHRRGRKEWKAAATLESPSGIGGGKFGYSVDISGRFAIVGAPGEDDPKYPRGCAYIYRRGRGKGWESVTRIEPLPGSTEFGYSVSISGRCAVVSSARIIEGHRYHREVHVFRHTGDNSWRLVDRIATPEETIGPDFGRIVSIDGDSFIVGYAAERVEGGKMGPYEYSGGAYVFRALDGNGWNPGTRITPGDGVTGASCGYSAAISGNLAVVSAPEQSDPLPLSGAVYIFQRNDQGSWVELAKVTGRDCGDHDEFGNSIDAEYDTVFVGAQFHPWNERHGAAYILRLEIVKETAAMQ